MFDALNVSLVAQDAISRSLRGIAGAADEAGTEATAASVEFGNFGEALDAVDDEAVATAVGNRQVANAVDEVGDEATESAAQVGAFRSSLAALGSADVGSAVDGLGNALGQVTGGGVGDQIEADLDAIPDAALESASSLDVLQLQLDESKDAARGFANRLNSLEGDERDAAVSAIEASESVDALALRLRSAGGDAEAAADDLNDLDAAALQLVDDALASSAGMRTLRSNIDEAGDEASQAAREIEDLGDEALQSAAKSQALSASMDSTARSSSNLAARLGPIGGSLQTVGIVAGAAAPPLFGLASALGGVATGAGAAAGGLGAIAFGGLQREAERMAATSSELEDSGEAMEKIFSNWGDALSDATDPLQTVANTEFVFSGMAGVVDLVEMASESVANLAPTIRDLSSSFGSSVLENAPSIFDELEKTVRALAPMFKDWQSVIGDIPGAIAFLRKEAVQLGPALASFTGSAVRAAASVADLGSDILVFALPPLTILIDMLGFVADVAASIPKPLQAAAIASLIAAAAFATYGGVAGFAAAATGALATAVGILTAPISGTALAIAALIGAVAGIITYFGWWDDILGALIGTWNTIVGVVEWAINTFLSLYDALGLLGPVLFPGIAILTNLGKIVDWVGGMFAWLAGVAADIFGTIMDVLGMVADAVEATVSVIDAVTDAVGLDDVVSDSDMSTEVDLSSLEAESQSGDGDDSDDGGDDGDDPPSQPPAAAATSGGDSGGTTYDFSGADFSQTDESKTKSAVKEAVKEANREDRAREDGRAG